MPDRFTTATLPPRAVMGIVNVTPDSFSDGGQFLASDAAIVHGRELAHAGAAIVDVGGESTRPHAAPVDAAEERRRVLPVVERLAQLGDSVISVDTAKAEIAADALASGATIVNDVTAGTHDPDMLRVVAEHDAGFIAMHMRGTPATMQDDPRYDDVVREVGDYLLTRLDAARAAGVRDDALLADPGIGFGKTMEHNLQLLVGLPRLAARVGVPVILGASRKSFLGTLTGGASVDDREDATLATTVWAFEHGARMVRVHDVVPSVRAARMLAVIAEAAA